MSNGLKDIFGTMTLNISLDVPQDVTLEKMREIFSDEAIESVEANFTDIRGFGYDLKVHDYHVDWDYDGSDEEI